MGKPASGQREALYTHFLCGLGLGIVAGEAEIWGPDGPGLGRGSSA